MKAIGKIGYIEVDFRNEKVSREGIPYTSELVTVFFESGDDVHMIRVFNSVFKDQKSEDCLRSRNLFVGARGEMTINYSFREYNGKKYPDVSMIKWSCDNAYEEPSPAPSSVKNNNLPEPNPQQLAAAIAESEEKKGNLPF